MPLLLAGLLGWLGMRAAHGAGRIDDCAAKRDAASSLESLAGASDRLTSTISVRDGRLLLTVENRARVSTFIVKQSDEPLEWDVALDDIVLDDRGLQASTYSDFTGVDLRLLFDPSRNGNSVSDPYFTGLLKLPFNTPDDALQALAMLKVLQGPCASRPARPAPQAGRPAPAPAPAPSAARCWDGAAIPSSGVCPTIVFPGRTPAPAPARAAPAPVPAPNPAPRGAAPDPILMSSLQAAARRSPLAPLSPALRSALRPLDEEIDRSASADPATPMRPSLIKLLWNGATLLVDRGVQGIPGCRDDLFSRNVCRVALFGPFYYPGATRDLNEAISDVVEREAGP